MRQISFLFVLLLFSALVVHSQEYTPPKQGTLEAFKQNKVLGVCPLKHTDVKTNISGFLARVNVRQEFENNFSTPIEAVYTFPLSQKAAVDSMTMYIGDRTIRAQIKSREEARNIYIKAKNAGKTAGLLDEERPNVFTQQVANIQPNQKVVIEISYVETLRFEDGRYEFVFPMTVEERYFPKSVKNPAVQKLSPPVAKRAGHDISLEVNIDAGVPIQEIRAKTHEIATLKQSENIVAVKLKEENEIPNRDFVLQFGVAGKQMKDAVLTHKSGKNGFFTLILQPPDKVSNAVITPKEIVFVLDTSGSMSGFPIEKAKESMALAMKNLHPQDTFNLITFAGDTHVLFEKPVRATPANLEKAQDFLASRAGGGGTEMMKAIVTALAPSDSQRHLRVVCFMTDGQVGNDMEIIGEVQKHPKARVFAFGIGDSVNRFLLDNVAKEGRGEVEYVSLKDDGSRSARRFYQRVNTPLLTDISIDWNGLPITDVYPKRIPDMFSAKPVIIYGRYGKGAGGKITLRGKIGGKSFTREIDLNLPNDQAENDVLGTLWARTKIDELTAKDYKGVQNENPAPEIKSAVTELGLQYRLMTQFTSFVAVEERTVITKGKPQTIRVPVYPAAGTVYEKADRINGLSHGYILGGFFGRRSSRGGQKVLDVPANVEEVILTIKQGERNISSAEIINGKAVNLVRPNYPRAAKAVKASGEVRVEITIDENGNVVSAKAVSGDTTLGEAAEQAAVQSKFSPTLVSGQKVKVSGIIVYNFELPKPTTEDLLKEKVHFWLFEALENKLKNLPPAENEAEFMQADGRAQIEISLTEKTPQVLEKLKSAGLEISDEPDETSVTGKIPLARLVELVEIGQVQYVAPKVRE